MHTELNHSFFCLTCGIHLYGFAVERLCNSVNRHNEVLHPMEPEWNPVQIVHSKHYTGPKGQPLESYTKPHGTTSHSEWGNAKAAPDITAKDIEMLAENGIKW